MMTPLLFKNPHFVALFLTSAVNFSLTGHALVNIKDRCLGILISFCQYFLRYSQPTSTKLQKNPRMLFLICLVLIFIGLFGLINVFLFLVSAGTPAFVIQEEFDRYVGLWWCPKLNLNGKTPLV